MTAVEEDLPEPRAGEVRVKMLAAGVSAYDLMVRSDSFPGFPRVPFTPGVDIVGVVKQLGPGVSTIEPRQRVAFGPSLDGGGYADFICQPASELGTRPPGPGSRRGGLLGHELPHRAPRDAPSRQRAER